MTSGTLGANQTLGRLFKGWVYSILPAKVPTLHGKRRKGLFYRHCNPGVLECQEAQDAVFWRSFLRPEDGGSFLEIGGDGVVGSHTLGLELLHGWSGAVHVQAGKPWERAKELRKCQVLALGESFSEPKQDLLAIHRPMASAAVWEALRTAKLQSKWVIVENREPDPQWCRLLVSLGYRMRFYFHDDEYYELQS